MKKILVIAVATTICSSASLAEINSPVPSGYIARAERMLNEGNYNGVLDQTRHAMASSKITPDESAHADYLRCKALLQLNDKSAPAAMRQFIDKHKGETLAAEATMALGDYYFHNAKYAEAHAVYTEISPERFNGADADNLLFRDGYSMLRIGETDLAESKFNALAKSKAYASASRFYRGYVAYNRQDYEQARNLLTSVDSPAELKTKASYYLTQIDFLDGNYKKVANECGALLADNSVAEFRNEILRLRGESYYHLGNEAAALKALREYADKEENPQPSALYILGVSEYRSGDYGAAIAHLGKVVGEHNTIGQSAYLHIGQSCLKIGRKDAAVMAFEKAYRMDFDRNVSETAFYNYAVAQIDGGRAPFGSSVAIFEDFLRNYPKSSYASDVEEYIVTGYMLDNDYENALRSINRVDNPSDKILAAKQRVLFTLGTREVATGNITSALSRFTQAKAIGQGDPITRNECNLWIGDCLYRQNRFSDAAKAFTDYLGNNPTKSNVAIANYNLGYSQFKLGNYREAASAYKKALAVNSATTKADIYNRLGDCDRQTRNFTSALANYNKAIAADASQGDYSLLQKASVFDNTSRQNDAIATVDSLIEKYPHSALIPDALLLKAECYSALKNNAKTISTYDLLVKNYASTAQGRNALLQRAIAHHNAGENARALADYKKVVADYPTSDEAKVAVDDMKRIFADSGNLDELAKIVDTIPNAPKLEKSEMEQLAFDAAERAFINNGSTQRLTDYLEQYENGEHTAKALSYLAKSATMKGDNTKALKFANRLVDEYPDADVTEDALALKGKLLTAKGDFRQALTAYSTLAAKTKSAALANKAQLECLRLDSKLADNKDAISVADKLLISTATPAEALSEVRYLRAKALYNTNHTEEANAEYQLLSRDLNDYYGAASAVELAQHQYDNKAFAKAEATAGKVIDSNTPHIYWIARATIVLSDALRGMKRTFEADEYIRNLRDNYPNSEPDIRDAINERLKQ